MKKAVVAKSSREKICSITLKELESKNSKFEFVTDYNLIEAETYLNLVLLSPSSQSNIGEKISKKLEKHIDEIVNEIVSALDVKNTYFFSNYDAQKQKEDLRERIKNDSHTFLCLYCSDTFLESLYSSIRNALAHGNIVKKGKFYYLYALSAKESSKLPEKERKLSFLLKFHKFNGLAAYMEAFRKFN